jgi:uncharacterized membrane protein YvlD (DUF360 family)
MLLMFFGFTLKNGIITALLLVLISWLIGNVGFLQDIEWLQLTLPARFWPIIVVALVFGLINGSLVPLVMELFKKAKGAILFAITLGVNTGALLLTARIARNSLYIGNWQTALVIAAVLAASGYFVFGREFAGKRR